MKLMTRDIHLVRTRNFPKSNISENFAYVLNLNAKKQKKKQKSQKCPKLQI